MKALGKTHKISANNVNHVEEKFNRAENGELDWKKHLKEAQKILNLLESIMLPNGQNFSVPEFNKDEVFVKNLRAVLEPRFYVKKLDIVATVTAPDPSY